jgi:hypothetical protein
MLVIVALSITSSWQRTLVIRLITNARELKLGQFGLVNAQVGFVFVLLRFFFVIFGNFYDRFCFNVMNDTQ